MKCVMKSVVMIVNLLSENITVGKEDTETLLYHSKEGCRKNFKLYSRRN
jgi:hypothetical protein